MLKIIYMLNIIIFGKPGSGKGTQASLIKDNYDLIHISTGDVFRKNISEGTELGITATQFMSKGELVPDTITISMLEEEIKAFIPCNGFIFDGFPRTTKQAEALDVFLSKKSMRISATLALEADDDILVERLINRGKSSGRADDQDKDKIRNRFDEYNNKTAPLRAFYVAQEKFHSVDGIGSVNEITQRLTALIDGLL